MLAKSAKQVSIDFSNYKSTLLISDLRYGAHDTYYQERVQWTTKHEPEWAIGLPDYMILNMPIFNHITETVVDEMAWLLLLIKVKILVTTD